MYDLKDSDFYLEYWSLHEKSFDEGEDEQYYEDPVIKEEAVDKWIRKV